MCRYRYIKNRCLGYSGNLYLGRVKEIQNLTEDAGPICVVGPEVLDKQRLQRAVRQPEELVKMARMVQRNRKRKL